MFDYANMIKPFVEPNRQAQRPQIPQPGGGFGGKTLPLPPRIDYYGYPGGFRPGGSRNPQDFGGSIPMNEVGMNPSNRIPLFNTSNLLQQLLQRGTR